MGKEQIIEEIIKYPAMYGLHNGSSEKGIWNKEKLLYMDVGILKDFYRDIKTFERNKKELNGNN